MFVTLFGITTLINESQSSNKPPPIEVTLLGIITLLNGQLVNALAPIVCNCESSANVILLNEEQFLNARSPIVCNCEPSSNVILLKPQL